MEPVADHSEGQPSRLTIIAPVILSDQRGLEIERVPDSGRLSLTHY
jgi:hypothetical protein